MFSPRIAMEMLDCEFAIRIAGGLDSYLLSLCKTYDDIIATQDARDFLLGIVDKQYQSYLVNEFRKNPKMTREQLQAIPYTVNRKELTDEEAATLQHIGIDPAEDSWYRYWIIKSRKGQGHNFPWGHDLDRSSFEQIREWAMDYNIKLPSFTLAEAWKETQESRKPPEKILSSGSWSLMKYSTEYQLIHESDVLEHCVGGGDYWKAMKDGELEIYSLWRKNTPVATFEIQEGKIEQCKGYGNDLLDGDAGEMAVEFARKMGWEWRNDFPCQHESFSSVDEYHHECDRCDLVGDHEYDGDNQCVVCGYSAYCPDGEHELEETRNGQHKCQNCEFVEDHDFDSDYDEDGEYCICGASQPHDFYSRPHEFEDCICRNCNYSPSHDWVQTKSGWECARCDKVFDQRPLTYTNNPEDMSSANYRNLMEDMTIYNFDKSPIEEYFPTEYVDQLLAMSDFRFLGDFRERWHTHKFEYFNVSTEGDKTILQKLAPPNTQYPDMKICLLCGESIGVDGAERQENDKQKRLPFIENMPLQSVPQK